VRDHSVTSVSQSDAQKLHRPEAPSTPRARRPWMIAVASGKGGVGKTNIVVNLAHELARSGKATTIIDGDLGLGNADLLCGVNTTAHFGEVLDGKRFLHEVIVDVIPQLRLLPGASGIAHLADLSDTQRRRMITALRQLEGRSEAIIIDCGAGIGPWVLNLLQASDQGLIVTTPEPPALADAYALIKCVRHCTHAQGRPIPKLELIVNQANSARQAKAIHQRINAVCVRFLRTELHMRGWIPVDPHVALAVRDRTAFVKRHPRCDASRRVRCLSASLLADITSVGDTSASRSAPFARILRLVRRTPTAQSHFS